MPSPIPESGSRSTNLDRGQAYKDDQLHTYNKDNNQMSNIINNNNEIGMGNDDVGIWSGLNLDQLRVEWLGTDASSPEYVLSTKLPRGLSPSDLSICVNEGTRMLCLSCRSQNHNEQKNDDGSMYVSQDSASYAQRAFTVPDDVDLTGIKATKNNTGGFQIHLPKNTNNTNTLQSQQQAGGIKQITIQ